ncbi:hypothetical protein Hesp01_75460 [Herbidospora sp. NBRC 101105]|nr:hypothetical protein Hesp01_75460 [Herbidospora sp. NBRC 101105]
MKAFSQSPLNTVICAVASCSAFSGSEKDGGGEQQIVRDSIDWETFSDPMVKLGPVVPVYDVDGANCR